MKRKFFSLFIGLCIVLAGGLWYYQTRHVEAKVLTAYTPTNLLRLHVVANSDSPADQVLKYKVRDEIIKTMAPKFRNVKTLADAEKVAAENLTTMEAAAQKVIKEAGETYETKAVVGNFKFPTKSYGELTLPAGEYKAVKVIIGKGEGANWWCVLFPPLCFVDITHGLTPEQVAAMQEVAQQDQQEIPLEVRFKTLEWLNQSAQLVKRIVE